jgi:putative DNA primase/helicase
MTQNLDPIRQAMAHPEDVDLPPHLASDPSGQVGHDDRTPEDVAHAHEADHGIDDGLPPPPPPGDGDGIDWDAVRIASEMSLNDLGNGQRFALHFGRDAMRVPRLGWHLWDSTRWALDPDSLAIRARAHCLPDMIARETNFLRPEGKYEEAQARREIITDQLTDMDALPKPTAEQRAEARTLKAELRSLDDMLGKVQDRIGQRLRHAKQAGNTTTLNNALKEAEVPLCATADSLDADHLAVNCLNGTLRFTVTRTPSKSGGPEIRQASVALCPHDRADRITKIMPVAYDPDAAMPAFQRFLNQIQPDPRMQSYLQRAFGLSMLGITEQIMFYLYGDGANGKSVLIDLIANILGTYAASAKIESLTGQNRRDGASATPDLVPMIGARFLRASEPEQDVEWQEGLIKALTGGEPMMIRGLNEGFIEVRPRFKLFVSGNHRPRFKGTDDGIWRRVKLLPFLEQIPEAQRINKADMDAALFVDAPGVLAWLVRGALDYLEAGLREPEPVTLATQALRRDSDVYGEFLDSACEITGQSGDRITADELVRAFNFWRMGYGLGEYRKSGASKSLADWARTKRSAKTGQKFTAVKSGGRMHYDGIRFDEAFAKLWQNAPKDQKGNALAMGEAPLPETTAPPIPHHHETQGGDSWEGY